MIGAAADGEPGQRSVRILDARGSVVGTGLLVGAGCVLTCAHVVTAALGAESVRGRPTGAVRVDLPAAGQEREAEVLPGGWFPAEANGAGDLAVLTVLGPGVDLRPARMQEGVGHGTAVRGLGYPPGHEEGVWLSARVEGPVGRSRMLSLDSGPRRFDGFGGAPVISRETGHVVGIITATAQEHGTALLLPTETIVDYWPPLAAEMARTDAARPADPLSLRDAGEIVDALLDVPDLADRRLRGLYAEMLAGETGGGPVIGSSDDLRHELWSLVTWCAPRPGAFHKLLEAIRSFHPADVQVEVLAERLQRIVPPPLLTDEERRELLSLLERCGPEDRAEALRGPAGSIAPRLLGAADDAAAVLQVLGDATFGPGGEHPLTSFVYRLAELQGPDPGTALYAWADAFVSRTGLARPRAHARTGTAHSYLTIQFDEDGIDPDRHLVSVRLERGEAGPVVLYRSDEPMTLAEAERRVSQVMRSELRAAGDHDDLVIEFLLPMALLGEPLDEWRLGPAESPEEPISVQHPVVVRSLDRLRDHSLHQQWRARWNSLRQEAVPGIQWASGDDRGELSEAIRAGVPAIAWVRGGHDPRAVGQLHALLGRTRLTDLPEKVHEIRKTALPGPGRRLQLLYDDPDRLPGESAALQIPEGAGDTA